jgi:predicted nucleic acid-binding protein
VCIVRTITPARLVTLAVPDTTVWVELLRGGTVEPFVRRGLRTGTIHLASVVLSELYVGAASANDKKDLDRIRDAFLGSGLTVTPTFDDWCAAGIVLARYARLYGAIDPRRHLNDVLILLCAVQIDAVLVTLNLRDMRRWNSLLPASQRVPVSPPTGARPN